MGILVLINKIVVTLSNYFENLKKHAELDSKMRDDHSRFLISYILSSKKEVVKITPLTLKINRLYVNLRDFIKEQWCIEMGYVELIKQNKKYIKVKLTERGHFMAEEYEYEFPIVHRNYLIRIIAAAFSMVKETKTFFLKTIPKCIRMLFSKKSGTLIMKTIAVFSAILGFIWLCIEMYEWAVRKGFI